MSHTFTRETQKVHAEARTLNQTHHGAANAGTLANKFIHRHQMSSTTTHAHYARTKASHAHAIQAHLTAPRTHHATHDRPPTAPAPAHQRGFLRPPHDCCRCHSVVARPATPAPAGGTGSRRDRQGALANAGTHTHTHTHAGHREYTKAHEYARTKWYTSLAGAGYGGRRAAGPGREQVGHNKRESRAPRSRDSSRRPNTVPHASALGE